MHPTQSKYQADQPAGLADDAWKKVELEIAARRYL
jgi:hypothetical protein